MEHLRIKMQERSERMSLSIHAGAGNYHHQRDDNENVFRLIHFAPQES
jgi:hypothetical protein